MPIHPDNLGRYPKDWPAISIRIRFERAGGRCECYGECGHDHASRCDALHGKPHPVTGSKVILTTAHLNHTPEDCRDEVLRAMCNRCHLAYDRDHHRQSREARKRKARDRVLSVAKIMAFQIECATGRRIAWP